MADNLVTEERQEFMVSPNGGHEHFRTAHFLTPSVTSIDGPVAAPAVDSLKPAVDAGKYKDLPFKANFLGWKHPRENWKTWVDQMHSLHHSTWKKAGILDAIMNSKCIIHRYDDLIFGFIEKWCPTANSFVFPWGEATITLEDMMVLGGYSVLGESVFSPRGDPEMEEKVKKLQSARSSISKTTAKKPLQSRWINNFMGSERELEHEAFLSYWLSKFVFPLSKDTIGRNTLRVAVHLASGTKIALAPAVLACIYKNLTYVKAALTAARKSGTKKGENEDVEVTVSAPLAFLQVWIWERFPLFRPNPNSVEREEPRLARWDNVKKLDIMDLLLKIDCAAESFQWRPYVSNGVVYVDKEFWALVGSKLDEDLEGLVRCIRTSEIVSLEADCIQNYLPHRVSMQFGMDQDLPGHVARINVNQEIAWRDYCRPIKDRRLYVPARFYEPQVTTRYLKWWKKLTLGRRIATEPGLDGRSSRFQDSKVEVNKDLSGKKFEVELVHPPPGFPPRQSPLKFEDDFVPPPPGFSPRLRLSSTANNSSHKTSKRKSFESTSCYDARVSSPGFAPDSGIGVKETVCGEIFGNNQSQDNDDAQGETNLSSTKNNRNTQETTLLVKSAEPETRLGAQDMKIDMGPSEAQSSKTEEPGIGLEGRIKNIEKLCGWILP